MGASDDLSATDSADSTAAAPDGTRVVRIAVLTADVRIKIGVGVTATATDVLFPAGTVEYVACRGGERVSAIRNASTNATVNVTFCDR